MSDPHNSANDPSWLDEFEQLANDQLGDGSACDQVHPIVEKWYQDVLEGEPPASRDSVLQAMACLSSEILFDAPPELVEAMMEHVGEEEFSSFVEYVLMVGRAFQQSLDKGELDDL